MQFLTIDYWFNMNAGMLHPPVQNLLIFFIIILFGSIFLFNNFKIIKYKDYPRSFWANLYSYSITNTIIGFLLLFFTYERVTLLSARFWFLLWLGYIICYPRYRFKLIDKGIEKREGAKKEAEFKKYIP
ncbi:hypothetical protein ISS03_03250 [Patescibacteria group bacterium]|nr:hypothetical protein [Patescibacteria group bacterium]